MLEVGELAPHYQLVVDRSATLARLEVQVEPAPAVLADCGGFRDDHPRLLALRAEVARRVQAALELSVEIRLQAPRTVPRGPRAKRCA